MDHFLTRLIARTLGEASSVEPLIPSIYENISDMGDGSPNPPRDEWRDPPHEGFFIPQHPRIAGRLSCEKDYSVPENIKNDRMDEIVNPSMKKPDSPDSNEDRINNLPIEVKATSSEENIVTWKPEYKLIPTKTVSLPFPEKQKKGSAHFPPSMGDDSDNRIFSVSGGELHRSGKSLVNAFQATGGGTDVVSRTNVERQQRESQQLSQDTPVQSAFEDLLVPSPSTDHNTVTFTEPRATVFESAPYQDLGPRSSPPPIKVTIGRIEVRAVMRPAPQPSAAKPAPKKTGPTLSLENYLRQRDMNSL